VLTGADRRRGIAASLSWVGVAVALSGVLTFGYLAVVTRSLPSVQYGWFGAYWSLTVVVALGVFQPVEVETARLTHLRGTTRPLPPGTVSVLTGVTTACVAAALAAAPLLLPALGREPGLYLTLLAVCVVSAAQFLLRGLLLGRGAYGTHGVVLLVDATLRVLLAVVVAAWLPADSAVAFGWTLPAAALLANVPLLVVLLRRPPRPPVPDAPPVRRASVARAVGQLTIGSLCAQVLLNAAPVLVAGLAEPGEQADAARFVASFTLVRLPLFVAVPLQSALVPSLVDLGRGDDRRALRRVAGRLVGGGLLLAVVGGLLGWLVGPALVSVFFGARYALPGPELGVLAAGTGLSIGLLVAGQALVAGARHRDAALSWGTGLVAGAVLFAVIPGLTERAAYSFTGGCAVAFLVASALLLHRSGRPTAVPA
jgi:O-antigen/teichoic acid export membrane protein